jgi:hypothetical protein
VSGFWYIRFYFLYIFVLFYKIKNFGFLGIIAAVMELIGTLGIIFLIMSVMALFDRRDCEN